MSLRQMIADERRELSEFLSTLDPQDWEHPSLCGKWRVRDVAAHLLYDSMPPRHYLTGALRAGPSVGRVNAHFVRATRDLPTEQLVQRLAASAEHGLLRAVLPWSALSDIVVHHQDIRRPLGRPRAIPVDRLRFVLAHPDPFAVPWRYTRGLRFAATDIPWAKGRGPEVRGTGEALVLAATGRRVVLDELTGDGVSELRRRITG